MAGRVPDDAPEGLSEAGVQIRRNIRDLMRWRRWSQVELAERLGVDQPWVSKRMTGKYRFSETDLDKLANVFGITPMDLLRPGQMSHDRRASDRRSGRDRRSSD